MIARRLFHFHRTRTRATDRVSG